MLLPLPVKNEELRQPRGIEGTVKLQDRKLCLLARDQFILSSLERWEHSKNCTVFCRTSAGAASTANGSHANGTGGNYSFGQKANPLRLGLVPPQPLDGKTEKQAYQRELHTVTVGEGQSDSCVYKTFKTACLDSCQGST